MMETDLHRPAVVVDALREILMVDRLPVGFLLGAGCPCSIKVADPDGSPLILDAKGSPLIPDAKGLTKAVVERSSDTDRAESFRRLQKMLVEDGQEDPTIEHMLTRVRVMETVVGNAKVRGFSASDLRCLEQSICRTISCVVNKQLPDPPTTPYHSLVKWIRQRTNRTVIFTTNYDLLVEQAFEALRVPFFDGFIGSYQPVFDQYAMEQDGLPARWALVCKLHGSINWRFIRQRNTIVRSLDKAGDELLIHPSHLKYTESRRMPYLVMLDRLKAFIGNDRKPAALFTIGYSFSDEHINDTIADSLQANPSAVCYALQYCKLSAYSQIDSLVERCSNLHVLARDGAVTAGRHSYWETCSRKQIEQLDGAFRSPSSEDETSEAGSEGVDGDEVAVEFHLGDFDIFGHFLASFSPVKVPPIGYS